jgi:hypothetical protein
MFNEILSLIDQEANQYIFKSRKSSGAGHKGKQLRIF